MSWQENQYQVEITKDGSPSLRSLAISTQESMHHSGGAYTETQLIYGEPLRARFDKKQTRVLSVGLGLGYIEMMVACEAIKRKIAPTDLRLVSYESEQVLKDEFLNFLKDERAQNEKLETYQKILEFFVADEEDLTEEKVKSYLLKAFDKKSWEILGKLSEESLIPETFNLIIYDAFSAKTTPELWTEEFLNLVWNKNADKNCSVATYACRTLLRKSLFESGFQVIEELGFQSKKKRTLAVRDAISS